MNNFWVNQKVYENIWKWDIISFNGKNTNNEIINNIHNLERETWSFFMWEYTKCIKCWNIDSKEDIYKKYWSEISIKSIYELEEIYWKNIKCSCCEWETEFLWWEGNEKVIKSRLNESIDSYISLYRDEVWNILGMIYGYVDNFETIFNREFECHFSKDLLETMQNIKLKQYITVSWLCILEEHKNLTIIFELIKKFFANIPIKYLNTPWVVESIVWSPTYQIFTKMWAKWMNLHNIWERFLINDPNNSNIQTDILFQDNVTQEYLKIQNYNIKDLIKRNKK